MGPAMTIPETEWTRLPASAAAQTPETRPSGGTHAPGGPSGAAPGGDRVEFSSALNHLAQAVSTYGQAHASKVQALAALYQSGGYRPDAMATSRSMVSEALAGAG
jgi:hypothetical protein